MDFTIVFVAVSAISLFFGLRINNNLMSKYKKRAKGVSVQLLQEAGKIEVLEQKKTALEQECHLLKEAFSAPAERFRDLKVS